VKPWDGYASRGTAVVRDRKELLFFARRIPNPIVQDFVEGTEHTCDVYVDFDMNVRCVVPRKRIEVRSGEVSKGQIVKNRELMHLAAELVKILEAGPGLITLQCFVQSDGSIKLTEINPRFGGGVPLAIKAGANFPKWIISELLRSKGTSSDKGKQSVSQMNISFDGFKDDLIMLRYDDEVWIG
jgi:carbamoyl-phosphate synthase large subunit